MFNASPRTLKILATLTWYTGVVVLYTKSTSLFIEAESVNPHQPWVWVIILSGLLFGAIKAKYLFRKLCLKNLHRIDMLQRPKLWHFYRLRFFIFLFSMVLLGAYFSRLAHGDYAMLLGIAFVDISVATALLGSSHCFWMAKSKIHEK